MSVQIRLGPFEASASAWDAVVVDLGVERKFTVPGKTFAELKRMKNMVTYTMMLPVGQRRPKIAARKGYNSPRPVSVQKIETEPTKAEETIELSEGCRITKRKSVLYKAGPRTVALRDGMLSSNSFTYEDFMFSVGPFKCELKNFPAYPMWVYRVRTRSRGTTPVVEYFPAGHEELANALPLAQKDKAEIALAGYEKAVGEGYDFDCLAMMLATVKSYASAVNPERRMPRVAKATKAARDVILDKGACYGDLVEISTHIGEAYEAANMMDDAILMYHEALQYCLAKPDQVPSDGVGKAWLALGIALKRAGHLDAAEACYRHCFLEPVSSRGPQPLLDCVLKVYEQRARDDESNKLANELSRKIQTQSLLGASIRCAGCGYPDGKDKDELRELMRCSGCRLVLFCSKECQRAVWPRHKEECRQKMEEIERLRNGETI